MLRQLGLMLQLDSDRRYPKTTTAACFGLVSMTRVRTSVGRFAPHSYHGFSRSEVATEFQGVIICSEQGFLSGQFVWADFPGWVC